MLQMRDAALRLWRFIQTPRGRKLFRYTMSSVISTVVSFGVLTLVYGVFRWWTEVPSTLFANVVATVPSYYLNRNWAWGQSGRSHVWREMVPFWAASVTGIVLSMGSASIARNISIDHHLHHLMATALVDGANLGTFVVLWVVKYLVFNRLFHTPSPLVVDEELVEAA